MATSVTQRELLTLIRDFATEKSQGERRVADLKKRIEELRSALDTINVDLEEAKRCKESAEQELKGYEVELTMNESSIQAQEARVSLIQDEISKIRSEVEAVKSKERICRDEFIREMFAFNKLTRKHQEVMDSFLREDTNTKSSAVYGENVDNMLVDTEEVANKQAMPDIEVELKKLSDKITLIISQTHQVEQEQQENLNNQKKIQQVFAGLENKSSLIKAVVKETKELQELTKQTAKLEETCSAFGEELQKRCICPSCHQDNVGELAGPLEGSQGS